MLTLEEMIKKKSEERFYANLNRFWSNVDTGKFDFTKCWNWKGKLQNERGYGSFYLNGKGMGAHRASYILTRGKIPDGMYICHQCDNPACVNPIHLFLGTQKENMKNCVEKGRFRGGFNQAPKYDKKWIIEMILKNHKISYIANVAKVSRVTVYNIKRTMAPNETLNTIKSES